MRGQECPLSLGSASVYSVFSVVCPAHAESLRTAGTAVLTLRLAKRIKNGEDFVLAAVGNIAWPGLLALAAGVLGFYGQGLFADTLAEIGQLGPAHTALAVDNHFFNAR